MNKSPSRARTISEILRMQTIKECVDYIYSITKDSYFSSGFRAFRKNNILMDTAFAALRIGFIVNHGVQSSPKYMWAAQEPNEYIYTTISNEISDNNRREECSGPQFLPPFAEEDAIRKKAHELVISPLKSFSDVDLWEELKARGYVIKDNKLVKTVSLS